MNLVWMFYDHEYDSEHPSQTGWTLGETSEGWYPRDSSAPKKFATIVSLNTMLFRALWAPTTTEAEKLMVRDKTANLVSLVTDLI